MYDPGDIPCRHPGMASWSRAVPRHYRLLRREYATRNPYVKSNDEWGWKELKARYWGLCTLMDKYIGRILDRLETLGLADDTIVVYTSDHGDMMGQLRMVTKSVQYEGAVRVPLLVRVPGLPPRRLATPISLVDLTPTLLDLVGLPIPAPMQGRSLASLMRTGDVAPDEAEVFVEWNGWDGIQPVWSPRLAWPIPARCSRRRSTPGRSGGDAGSSASTPPAKRSSTTWSPTQQETHNAVDDPAHADVVSATVRSPDAVAKGDERFVAVAGPSPVTAGDVAMASRSATCTSAPIVGCWLLIADPGADRRFQEKIEYSISCAVMNSSSAGVPSWVCSIAALDGRDDLVGLGDALAVAAERLGHVGVVAADVGGAVLLGRGLA